MSARLSNSPRIETTDEFEDVGGLGLSVGEVRSVARRQLIGSVVAAMVVAAAAGVMAVQAARHAEPYVTAHNFPVVQKPTLVTPPGRLTAAVNRAAEVP
jgi:hypothetical protein